MKNRHIASIVAFGLSASAALTNADLLVYEPFYYQPVNDEVDGRLAGKTGGLGWGGAWLDSPNTVGTDDHAFVFDSRGNLPGLYDGPFGAGNPDWDGVVDDYPTVGGYVGLSPWNDQGINQARINSHRTLAQSAGEMAGVDGVLWMSMVVHYPNAAFQTRPGFALTDGGHFNDRAQTLDTGNGIGIGAGQQWPAGQLNAVIWNNGDGTSNVRTEGPNISSASLDSIIVVKFEFGPTEDTVSTWAFTEEQTSDPDIFNEATFNTNAVSVTADIDESTLNTLAFAMTRQENAIDEIRIGTTFESVLTLPDAGPVDADASRVSASPAFVPADGVTPATVTVSLTDSLGIPISGKDVTLAGSPDVATIMPDAAVVTDANGQATFTVTSTTGGAVVFTATNATDSQVITQTASVNFPSSADASLSTVVASASGVVADGELTANITVTLKDPNGFPISDKEVSLAANPDHVVIGPDEILTTNSSGQAVFTVSSTTIGTVEFTATETGEPVVINQTATVDFVDPDMAFSFNVNFFTFTPAFAGPFFPENESELFGPAGGLETRWNQFNAPSGTNLFDPTGVLTGVSFTTNFTEGRAGGADNTPMLRSTLTDFAKGTARTFTISGLPPGTLYDVWLASYRDSAATNERTHLHLRAEFSKHDTCGPRQQPDAISASRHSSQNPRRTQSPQQDLAPQHPLPPLRRRHLNRKRPVFMPRDSRLSGQQPRSHVVSRNPNPSIGSDTEASRWLGYRELTDEEIRQLAEAVVRQVKIRGPFRSLGEFVNRRRSNDVELARYGALQVKGFSSHTYLLEATSLSLTASLNACREPFHGIAPILFLHLAAIGKCFAESMLELQAQAR